MKLIVTAALGLLASAHAGILLPSSYTTTPGEGQAQGGSFNYFDDTGKQLTDGILGANNWLDDLGNGPAYEWVGWVNANPTLSYSFAGPVTVQKVSIGFNQGIGGVGLPGTVTIGGTSFLLTGSEVPSGQRGTLAFLGNWSGNSLQIDLSDANGGGPWIFVDEISFDGDRTVVPEPAASAVALGVAVAGYAAYRRSRRA